MRGDDPRHDGMFSYITPEARVRPDHPLRPIRRMTDAALERLSSRFDRLYSTIGRPSIPPEKLLRALLLQLLYSIRSERLLMEELDYNILYRWFVGLSLDDPIWDATTFTKNRNRLLDGDVADAFFTEVLAAIQRDGLLSDEHFTVDGTLLEAWASHKSFKPKGGDRTPPDDPKNPTVNFHGQIRRNDTHQSTTDPEARLYKKGGGHEAKLAYLGHLLTENRHGFIVNAAVTDASGTGERDAAIAMLGELPLTSQRVTVAADKLFDRRAWVAAVRRMRITPHVAQYAGTGGSAIDGRTTRHPGYAVSQRRRKLIEQAFGWMKTVGLLRRLRHRGGRLVDWIFTFAAAAYNLVRWRNLVARPA
ncbi:MAG TPA: IS5 family transposase [Thermoanaerobaculia bacterium]|nr:IS5 family transposase [Thermoanaerobaculia bacterium]